MSNAQMTAAIAAIKTGKTSPYSAFKMVDDITEEQKDILRKINEAILDGVYASSAAVERMSAGGEVDETTYHADNTPSHKTDY